MKKVMESRKPYVRKEPVYTPREEIALAGADRIVTRIHLNGEWMSRDWFPEDGQSLLDVLTNIQSQLRHSPDLSKVCLYVGGNHPDSGEFMIAACPHEWVPTQVLNAIKDK